MAAALLAALAPIAPAPAVHAQGSSPAYSWRNVTVGGGGYIPSVVFSPVERGLAYARSDMGGAYRFDAARGRWIPLEDGFAEGSFQGVESIAPDPKDPNVVYAAVGVGYGAPAAILRSHDRGDHWDVVPVRFQMGGNEDGRGVGERLAVDPNDTRVLYFGSRHDGLQRSTDGGRSWTQVASFPLKGLGAPPMQGRRRATHAGLSFVIFDPASGHAGQPSRTIFVASADPGPQHLFRSDDAGASWRAVEGGARPGLLPLKGALDDEGRLYVTYGDGMGPNGVKSGAVFRLDTRSGRWTDITPDKSPDPPEGGYIGVTVARGRPGVVMVSTISRFHPGDTVWRSRDGGETWEDVKPLSRRDVSASPFLLWGEPEADFGWWISTLAIDPFDPDHALYGTGATLYATHDLTDVDRGRVSLWTPWVAGIEQTAIITLNSPPAGPPLLSGFGDISGFAHEDLGVSPTEQFTRPVFGNTDTIEVAGENPAVVVRSGTAHGAPHGATGATLAWSADYGRSWRELRTPAPTGDAAIVISADGSSFVVATPTPLVSRDHGATWTAVKGLPAGARPVADKRDPARFYALDFATSRIFVSTDAGVSFAPLDTRGLPALLPTDAPKWREAAWPLYAAPGRAGELWLVTHAGLFRSTDGGRRFGPTSGGLKVQALGFGKAAPGSDHPTLFALGELRGVRAVWRSDDQARSWVRVNDAAHEYGRRFRCIAGDPRVFGRVYVGADGRGVVYGEPVAASQSRTR